MALIAFPSVAKIAELQLAIVSVFPEERRPLLSSRGVGASVTEMWAGQVALATVGQADAHALAAWLDSADGRVNDIAIPLVAGYATHAGGFTGTLASNAAAGAGAVYLANSGALIAGTLLAIGTAGSAGYQVVEVLDDVIFDTATPVYVAPRIRNVLSAGTPVTSTSIVGAFRLAKDDTGTAFELDRGRATLSVIEALL